MTAATPGQAAIPLAELEAAAAAIMTAQNANDDEPERFEAMTLARAALGAARDLAAQGARPAPGVTVDALAAALADTRPPVIIDGIAEPHTLARPYDLAVQVIAALGEHAQPKPAPELAAAMAETRELRELLGEVLGKFGPSGSGHTARVGQVQIARWRKRAGLPA